MSNLKNPNKRSYDCWDIENGEREDDLIAYADWAEDIIQELKQELRDLADKMDGL